MIYQITIPCPLRQIFEYIANDEKYEPKLGTRILVPFGNRKVIGILVGIKSEPTIHNIKLKPIEKILDSQSILSSSIDKLLYFANKFYLHPLGLIYDCAMPSLLKKPDTDLTVLNSEAQVKIIASIKDKKLLNSEQQLAVDTINTDINNKKNNIYLLNGVTGSGKTEVYLQLIENAINNNLQSIIIVPEIGLTPQTINRFKNRFNAPIAVIHSKLTAKEKLISWQMAKAGISPIVIGTRSAIFTPLKNPGTQSTATPMGTKRSLVQLPRHPSLSYNK